MVSGEWQGLIPRTEGRERLYEILRQSSNCVVPVMKRQSSKLEVPRKASSKLQLVRQRSSKLEMLKKKSSKLELFVTGKEQEEESEKPESLAGDVLQKRYSEMKGWLPFNAGKEQESLEISEGSEEDAIELS
mmetsp:Transcript_3051/g.2043  ORF Transcript_3051/g.2043 Transcript_3051/m.2043 type:complete len:132 (-) Transcript_3051:452-847(-)